MNGGKLKWSTIRYKVDIYTPNISLEFMNYIDMYIPLFSKLSLIKLCSAYQNML